MDPLWNWLIGMQISAEIHSPQNKREINIIGSTQTTYTWGGKTFTIVDMRKGKRKRDQDTQILSPSIYNLTTSKWLLTPVYEKTRFQSRKVTKETRQPVTIRLTYDISVIQIQSP